MGHIGDIIAFSASYGILAVVSFLVYECYRAVPAPYRSLEPARVWLLLIPVFNVAWNFLVFPGLSKSYKAYFDSVGDATVGDCGGRIALWFCVAMVGGFLPFLSRVAAPASLLLLIIYLIKAYELKAKIKV